MAALAAPIAEIAGPDHYYAERPDLLPKAAAATGGRLDERSF